MSRVTQEGPGVRFLFSMAVCLSVCCLRALNTQQTRAHFTISAPNCKLKLAHNK
ncbi:unnamed protein product [Ectocarpus sp. CCAP 1310/34]|nr:unnamed protein product [Ectocarpus sp. CCAP 1310/34]